MHMSDDRASRLAAAEAFAIKALSIAPEKASGHFCLGVVQIYTKQGRARDFRIRACARDRPKSRRCLRVHRYGKVLHRSSAKRLKRTSKMRSGLVRATRSLYLWQAFVGAAKVFLGKDEEAVAAIAPFDREQPEFPARAFLPRGRPGGARSIRRGARRGEGSAFHRSHLHHPPLPRRCARATTPSFSPDDSESTN